MSLDAFRWVCQQKAPSTGAFAVLCALANFTGKDRDVSWPSQKKIAEMTCMCRRSVITHLDALCDVGLVERDRGSGNLRYRLKMNVQVCANTAPPCADFSRDSANTAQACANSAHPSEPVKEPENINSKRTDIIVGSLQARFAEFWELYPKQRRGNKSKALSAYNRALTEKRATEKEIHDGLSAYIVSDEVNRGFAKGAAAWLNDDRWANDYARVSDQSSSANNQSRESYFNRLAAASRRARDKIYTDDTAH